MPRSLFILGVLGFAATGIKVGEPQAAALADSGPGYQGLVTLQQEGVPTGVITPIQLLPALMALLGKWNWWLPTWAERCLFPPSRQQRSAPAYDSAAESHELKHS